MIFSGEPITIWMCIGGSPNSVSLLFFQQRYFISIHAPTQGATLDVIEMDKRLKISIHAPMQGATLTI